MIRSPRSPSTAQLMRLLRRHSHRSQPLAGSLRCDRSRPRWRCSKPSSALRPKIAHARCVCSSWDASCSSEALRPRKRCQAFRDLLAIDPDHSGGLRGLETALRALPRALENPITLDALASHLESMSSAWRADRRLSAWLEVERAALLEKLRRPDAARAALEGAMGLDGGIGPVRDAYTRHLVLRQNANLLVAAGPTKLRSKEIPRGRADCCTRRRGWHRSGSSKLLWRSIFTVRQPR